MIVRLPVTWEVCGFVEVEADTICDAMDIFDETLDHIPLPSEFDYCDGSFDLAIKEPEVIQVYNEDVPIGSSKVIYSNE